MYLCTTEARDPFNYPIYFMTPKTLDPPNSYKFPRGIGQKFPEKVAVLNVSKIKLKDLVSFREDYYPLIINMESLNPDVIDDEERLSQVSYAVFTSEKHTEDELLSLGNPQLRTSPKKLLSA